MYSAFPLQELRGNFTGPGLLVHVTTVGTSPERPFTGTFTFADRLKVEQDVTPSEFTKTS